MVLFDELDRLANFSRRPRLAAYRELAWWQERAAEAGSGILPVFTVTSGATDDRPVTTDEVHLPSGEGKEDARCRRGYALLRGPKVELKPATPPEREEIKHHIQELYSQAYGVRLGELPAAKDRNSTVRQDIRRWIAWCDLQRYYPDCQPDIVAEEITLDEREVEDDLGDAGADEE